jgi:hypothetical protein
MIRVTTIYPRFGKEDFEKYKEDILPIIIKMLKPLKVESYKGINDLFDNPPKYNSIVYFFFKSIDILKMNYSLNKENLQFNIESISQISEVFEIDQNTL